MFSTIQMLHILPNLGAIYVVGWDKSFLKAQFSNQYVATSGVAMWRQYIEVLGYTQMYVVTSVMLSGDENNFSFVVLSYWKIQLMVTAYMLYQQYNDCNQQ